MTLNRQVALDLAVNGLLAQGHKAMNDGGCVYLAEDGSRCAVGMMIDTDKYFPEVEGAGVFSRAPKLNRMLLPEVGHIMTDEDIDFLSDLQTELHDAIVPYHTEHIPRETLLERATTLAEKYGLTVNLTNEGEARALSSL